MATERVQRILEKGAQIRAENSMLCHSGYRPLGTLVESFRASSSMRFIENVYELSGGDKSRQFSQEMINLAVLDTMRLIVTFTVRNATTVDADMNAAPNSGTAGADLTVSGNNIFPSSDRLFAAEDKPLWVIDPLKLFEYISIKMNGSADDLTAETINGMVSSYMWRTILGENGLDKSASPCLNPYHPDNRPVCNADLRGTKNGIGYMFHGRNRYLSRLFPMDTDAAANTRWEETYEFSFPLQTIFNRKGVLIMPNCQFRLITMLRDDSLKTRSMMLINSSTAAVANLGKFVPSVTVSSIKLRYQTLNSERDDSRNYISVRSYMPKAKFMYRHPYVVSKLTIAEASGSSQAHQHTFPSQPLYVIAAFIRDDNLAPNTGGNPRDEFVYRTAPDSFHWFLPEFTNNWQLECIHSQEMTKHSVTLRGSEGVLNNDALATSYINFVDMLKMGEHPVPIPSYETWVNTTPCLCLSFIKTTPNNDMASKLIVNDTVSLTQTSSMNVQWPTLTSSTLPNNLRAVVYIVEQRSLIWDLLQAPHTNPEGTTFGTADSCGENLISGMVADIVQRVATS